MLDVCLSGVQDGLHELGLNGPDLDRAYRIRGNPCVIAEPAGPRMSARDPDSPRGGLSSSLGVPDWHRASLRWSSNRPRPSSLPHRSKSSSAPRPGRDDWSSSQARASPITAAFRGGGELWRASGRTRAECCFRRRAGRLTAGRRGPPGSSFVVLSGRRGHRLALALLRRPGPPNPPQGCRP